MATTRAAVAECGAEGPVLSGASPAASVCGSRVVIYVFPHNHGWARVPRPAFEHGHGHAHGHAHAHVHAHAHAHVHANGHAHALTNGHGSNGAMTGRHRHNGHHGAPLDRRNGHPGPPSGHRPPTSEEAEALARHAPFLRGLAEALRGAAVSRSKTNKQTIKQSNNQTKNKKQTLPMYDNPAGRV